MSVIAKTRTSNLNGSLKFLHFNHVESLLLYIQYCITNNIHFDLCLRLLDFVLNNYEYKIFASSKMMNVLRNIQRSVDMRMKKRVDLIGYNLNALRFILKEMKFTQIDEIDLPMLKKLKE